MQTDNIQSKTAAALGFFDGLHLGHRAVIEAARKAGERLGIPLSVLTFKGEPELPKFGGRHDMCLMTYDDKEAVMRSLGAKRIFAYEFTAIRDMSPEDFFGSIVLGIMNAAYISCGEDFRFGKGGSGDAELLGRLCAQHGIELEIIPPVCAEGVQVSSSLIRGLIRDGDIEAAAEMLGRRPSYTLPVLHGRKLGRELGFPTINQEIPPFMVRAKRGVYASVTELDGREYPAITNIGVKPTVKEDDAENMETHIIGFDGDLYDKWVKVSLCRFMREEKKFGGIDELKAQLEADRKTVLGYEFTK